MTDRTIVFPSGIWDRVRKALFPPDKRETFLMGLARPCRRIEGICYVVEHVLGVHAEDYLYQSPGGLSLNDTASSALNILSIEAAKLGLVPVHIHSHPPWVSTFSGYDDSHEKDLYTWLLEHGQPLLWSVVWPWEGNPIARLWVRGEPKPGMVRAGLQPFGVGRVLELPALDRQKVFGSGLRTAASMLGVGIVGVGGIGFLVAEQLARCGFQRFVLMDPDRVEVSNLNRLPGTTSKDIGRPKVRVAKRLIREAGRSIGTRPTVYALAVDIYRAPGWATSQLRRCDIILGLTDNELSRIECLKLALEAGAEYLQAGVNISVDARGKVQGLYAEITGAEVNRYCPICSGRLDPGQASVESRFYVGGEVWEHAKERGYIPGIPDPAVMSLNAIAAGMLVLEIQRRIAGLGSRDLLQIEIQKGSMISVTHFNEILSDSCEVCGRGEKEGSIKPSMLGRD